MSRADAGSPLYKEPGGRESDAHQDQPYWPIEEPLTVTAWIPFDGCRPGAAGLFPRGE